MGEAVRAYLSAKTEMASHFRAETAWKAAKDYWDNLPIARVDPKASELYRERRSHCKAITVRNELAVIRAALNWAEKQKLIERAPFIQMPKIPPYQIGHLTKDQFRQLLAGAEAPHIKLFMQIAVATGARTNAILDLTWDRVDFARGIITLNPYDRVQTSKYRATVPMNDQLKAVLKEAKAGALSQFVIEHGMAKVGSIKKGFAAAAKRSGVTVTPHMLRHSAACWMAEAGVPMSQIARFLGHSDSRLTEKTYAKFSPDFLQGAAVALTW